RCHWPGGRSDSRSASRSRRARKSPSVSHVGRFTRASNSGSASGSYAPRVGFSSASMASTRPSKTSWMRSRWQSSSLSDHLSGTVRRASSSSPSPAVSRVTSSACSFSRCTMRACTACLSWAARAKRASSAMVTSRRPRRIAQHNPRRGPSRAWDHRRMDEGEPGAIRGAEAPAGSDPHGWSRAVFLRALGFVYLAAFLSLWVQAEGLIGARGILPFTELLELGRTRLGVSRYWVLPTVLWLGGGDAALHVVCALGCALALVALWGRARAWSMLALWALYLSLASVAEDFLGFQWDALLLEAGLLAVLLAPRGLVRARPGPTPALVVWLYRWLLF